MGPRVPDHLQRVPDAALGYLVASIVWLNLGCRWQIAVTLGLLVGYWALQTFVPVPGYGAGVYREHALFGDWLNDRILGDWQGRWRLGWILGIMTARVDGHAGRVGRADPAAALAQADQSHRAGGAGVGLPCRRLVVELSVSHHQEPLDEHLCPVGRRVELLVARTVLPGHRRLAIRRWAYPFMVLGTNSIFVYMAWGLCNGAFKAVADCFLGGLAAYTGPWQSGIAVDRGIFRLLAAACLHVSQQNIPSRLNSNRGAHLP